MQRIFGCMLVGGFLFLVSLSSYNLSNGSCSFVLSLGRHVIIYFYLFLWHDANGLYQGFGSLFPRLGAYQTSTLYARTCDGYLPFFVLLGRLVCIHSRFLAWNAQPYWWFEIHISYVTLITKDHLVPRHASISLVLLWDMYLFYNLFTI